MRTGIGIFASGKGRPPHVRLQQILDGGAACVFIEAARWGRPRTNVWISLEARVLTVHEAFRAGGGEEEIMARHLSNQLRTRLEAIDRAGAAEYHKDKDTSMMHRRHADAPLARLHGVRQRNGRLAHAVLGRSCNPHQERFGHVLAATTCELNSQARQNLAEGL